MLSEYTDGLASQVCDSSWYAVYTRHQHEKMVHQVLTSKGFNSFLPLYATTHNWKDRTKALTLPLFPCYVFLKGGIERRLQILTTPGIYGVVSSAGQPAAIPDIEIESIRRVVDSGARVETHPYLKCGNWVRVKSVPWRESKGYWCGRKMSPGWCCPWRCWGRPRLLK
jgi:transcription antitermination factor NusG